MNVSNDRTALKRGVEDLVRSRGSHLPAAVLRSLSVRFAALPEIFFEGHRELLASLEAVVSKNQFERLPALSNRYAGTACAAGVIGMRVDPRGASRFLALYACTQSDPLEGAVLAAGYVVHSRKTYAEAHEARAEIANLLRDARGGTPDAAQLD